MANHVDGIDMEYTLDAWGDAPPLAGHTLFAEAATEKQRADLAGMTLATLCDMVLGEDATDRSDDALVRAVGMLKRERDAANKRAEQAEAALGAAIDQRNEAERFVNENYDLIGYWRDLFKRANAEKRKARTDARVLRAYGVE